MDWGVGGDGDEDIYQTPVGGLVPQSTSPNDLSLKRSETTGHIADGK